MSDSTTRATAAHPVVLLDRFELGRIYDGHTLTCLTTDGREVVLRLPTPEEALLGMD